MKERKINKNCKNIISLKKKKVIRLRESLVLQSCKNATTGVVGKCCRDPNYVDPWPTGNLPANYTGGFDEQGFPTFLNIAKVRPPKKPVTQPPKTSPKPPPFQPTSNVPLVSDETLQRVVSISTQVPTAPINTPAPFVKNPYVSTNQDIISIVQQLPNSPCGTRNYVSIQQNEIFNIVRNNLRK